MFFFFFFFFFFFTHMFLDSHLRFVGNELCIQGDRTCLQLLTFPRRFRGKKNYEKHRPRRAT